MVLVVLAVGLALGVALTLISYVFAIPTLLPIIGIFIWLILYPVQLALSMAAAVYLVVLSGHLYGQYAASVGLAPADEAGPATSAASRNAR